MFLLNIDEKKIYISESNFLPAYTLTTVVECVAHVTEYIRGLVNLSKQQSNRSKATRLKHLIISLKAMSRDPSEAAARLRNQTKHAVGGFTRFCGASVAPKTI